jgi:hypothetical protein
MKRKGLPGHLGEWIKEEWREWDNGNGRNGIEEELREWDSGEWKECDRRATEGMG